MIQMNKLTAKLKRNKPNVRLHDKAYAVHTYAQIDLKRTSFGGSSVIGQKELAKELERAQRIYEKKGW